MSWGAWLVLFFYLVVCLGPLRRPFFRRWRFTLPGSIAGWFAFFLASSIRQPGEPWWGPVLVGVMVALGAGVAAKGWLDQELGKDD